MRPVSMKIACLTLTVAMISTVATVSAVATEAPMPDRGKIQAAVRRSIPLLQESADTWFQKRSCFSCHHQGLGSATMGVVREMGYPIDDELYEIQIDDIVLGDEGLREYMLQGVGVINPQISISFELFGFATMQEPPTKLTNSMVHYLAGKQMEDGHWLSESHRPPLEDSEYTATALCIRSLQAYAPPARSAETAERLARARGWLEQAKPRTTEERAMHLLGLAWSGAGSESIGKAARDLVGEQREDGGWSQLPFASADSRWSKSDVYATGLALLALHQGAELSVTDPAVRKGTKYLLDTQHDDGSWHVATRRTTAGNRYFESGYPHDVDQFISYAAGCYATMALAVIGDRRQTAETVFLSRGLRGGNVHEQFVPTSSLSEIAEVDARDDHGMTALMEACVSGTLDDVKRLLDRGADVNLKSEQGVTALMCAVHDPAKVELLLSRGADVNVRSGLRYCASILAAGYDGSLAPMQRLLAAEGEAAASNYSACFFNATMVGDRTKADWLLERGASLEVRANGGQTALHYAAHQNDVPMMRFLLDRGASIEPREGRHGVTPLIVAARNGFQEQVDLLLSRGAAANAADERGMTALIWAATVDPGHLGIVDALLAAGADLTLETDDGRTAVGQAEQFEHRDIEARLLETGSP